jgi:tRNA (cytidine/uridine-2'-O-)-methyltransferase
MLHVALYEPEIPANTGNVGRLCVAAGATLHLVGRVGFRLDDRSVRRAGLDQWREVELFRHATLEEFESSRQGGRVFCFSAHASVRYTQARYEPGDSLLFGGESDGLPPGVVARYGERALCIPLPSGKARSLNLANAVAIALYEALRQLHGW